jgi:hypothetical protein
MDEILCQPEDWMERAVATFKGSTHVYRWRAHVKNMRPSRAATPFGDHKPNAKKASDELSERDILALLYYQNVEQSEDGIHYYYSTRQYGMTANTPFVNGAVLMKMGESRLLSWEANPIGGGPFLPKIFFIIEFGTFETPMPTPILSISRAWSKLKTLSLDNADLEYVFQGSGMPDSLTELLNIGTN